jgi:hypothetical protein
MTLSQRRERPEPVRERPLLFTGPMIRAILSGAKTQTRRILNVANLRARLPYAVRSDFAELLPETAITALPATYRATMNPHGAVSIEVGDRRLGVKPGEFDFVCPYAQGATRLVDGRWRVEPHGRQLIWVKETHAAVFDCPELPCECEEGEEQPHRRVVYRATEPDGIADYCKSFDDDSPAIWRPSIFMRRRDSRITLEVTGVRVERLQDIGEDDARSEGVELPRNPMGSYRGAFMVLWDSINADRASWASNPWVWVVNFKQAEVPHGR